MKFDTLEDKDAISIGDIKNNNVSIDTSNINFIVTILSTNLYSKPIQSFIRETVSNAWDSHVEAGITEPVILELGTDTEGNNFCRIQDFGVGLSPERFNSVYRNIGSSTKRGDNNQIGGFGIGRFSALAYSDVVHITSNYEGIEYKYIMYKDGNTISIDLLHEQETTERNGVEVQVQLKSHIGEVPNFYSAIKEQLVYFENIYFIDNTLENSSRTLEFNTFHIKKYKDFLVNDLDSNSRYIDLVLGKVRYPLRIDSLTKNYPKYVSNYPISLVFNIGDLEVTPNREEILYSTKNVEKIESALDLAIEELDGIFLEHSEKNFTVLSEYIEALKHSHQAPLLTVNGENTVYIKIPSKELKITYNNKLFDKDNFIKTYDAVMSISLIPIHYEVSYGGKIMHNSYNINLNKLKENFTKMYMSDITSLNSMSKYYIRDTFETNTKFIHTKKNIQHFYKKYFENLKNHCNRSYSDTFYDSSAIKEILKSVVQNIYKIRTFTDNHVPKAYIDKRKADEKAKRALRKNAGVDWSENVNIFNVRESNGYNKATVDSTTYNLKQIKTTYTKQTVYDDKNSDKVRALFNISYNNKENVNLIEVAGTRQKLLKNFDNFVKLEDFMSVKYKLIRQIGTARLIEETIPFIHKLHQINPSISKISTKLYNTINELSNYNKKYISTKKGDEEKRLINEIYQLCLDKNYFDENVRATLNSNLSILKNAEALLLFAGKGYSEQIPDERINLVIDYVLARKLFRPDIPAVVKMKKETILNIKTNEDNQN